ncbi:MAG: hypothetical protein IPM16_06705 [Chloroflexi bacterium]|nr:hypothetical protein [Chloroflexota bacterium]
MAALNGLTVSLDPGVKHSIDITGSDGSAGATVTYAVTRGYAAGRVVVTVDDAQPGTINVLLTDSESDEDYVDLDGDNSGAPRVVRLGLPMTDKTGAAIDGQYMHALFGGQLLVLTISGGNAQVDAVTVKFDLIAAH